MKVKTLFYSLALGAAVASSPSIFAKEHHKSEELTDATFVKKAAAGGMTEVELGKLAASNGDAQDVKDFGSKMVTDHGKANDQLKAIADKDKMMIPDKPMEMQQAKIDKMSKMTGKAFDSAYIKGMIMAHKQDKELFTEEAANTKNPDLKQFADDTLQVVKEHLTMIESIASDHGMAGGSMHKKEMGGSSTMMAPASGDAGQSKSGAGPGSTGNASPDMAPSMAPAPSTSGGNMTTSPSTGDAGQSKSGVAPGGNANPAPNPQ